MDRIKGEKMERRYHPYHMVEGSPLAIYRSVRCIFFDSGFGGIFSL